MSVPGGIKKIEISSESGVTMSAVRVLVELCHLTDL